MNKGNKKRQLPAGMKLAKPPVQPKSARTEKFKNPLLGIEVELMRSLQEVELKYRGASYKKRALLLNALEDIANTQFGFRSQILDCVKHWKSPETSQPNIFNETAVSDLIHLQNDYRIIHQQLLDQQEKTAKVSDQLEDLRTKKENYDTQVIQMKKRILEQSDYFAPVRNLNHEIEELRKTFDEMFIHNEPELSDEEKRLQEENEEMKKELRRMKNEFELVKQMSKKLCYLEEHKDE